MLLEDYKDLFSPYINSRDEKFLRESIIKMLSDKNFSISDSRVLFKNILRQLERENIIGKMKNHDNA